MYSSYGTMAEAAGTDGAAGVARVGPIFHRKRWDWIGALALLSAVVLMLAGGMPGPFVARKELLVVGGPGILPMGGQSMMLEMVRPSQGGRKSRRMLALEAQLDRAMQGVASADAVDYGALEGVLRTHLSMLSESNDADGSSADHEKALQAEVERLSEENAALREAGENKALTQIKSPLWPYQSYHFGYPFGYDKGNGWHQEIESYDPLKDGCQCWTGSSTLNCNCGSAWGALTLQDDACYGCCTHGCCNRCSCSTSHIGDNMGPTTCSCPLARNWHSGNANGCPGWWADNAGPLDPGGTGGIPVVEDEPGTLS